MYKFKEQIYSLDDISKAANDSNMNIEDYIQKAGITQEPDEEQDFLNPTAPGAVVGETTAPDTESPSVDGSLESVSECPPGYTKNSNGDCEKTEFQGQGFGVRKKKIILTTEQSNLLLEKDKKSKEQAQKFGKDAFNNYFIGNIGPVQIYNRALSSAEIKQNYNALKGRFI